MMVTKTEIMASSAIIRTLSGVILLSSEIINEEHAVTNVTDRPIVRETDRRFVTPSAEQMPRTETKIWLLSQTWSVRYDIGLSFLKVMI